MLQVDPSEMLEATGTGALFSAHIPLPSQEDIAKQLLEKRKQVQHGVAAARLDLYVV